MKKVTLILATVSLMIFASCQEKTEKETVVEKTIVVEQEPDALPPPPPPAPVDNDGTKISVNKDGVEFSNKDGKGNTEINIDTKKDK